MSRRRWVILALGIPVYAVGLAMLATVFLVALALGMWRVQSREVRLPAAVA